ncbi:MAG: glycosyltransferase family 4 protein [Armatimonadota bacterium]|nr:glycosyltransferase family 4 protein [Armatimonadota bacterium]MDR7451997.1 glycosyltransferase family 4 protein [Armatimonadota bacterium]MDR7467888.1 glycosyltransferase family 4 protein [Armatimonadota bacterium]MDR7494259.1 glycosyltransferase family 4 protein [Armatimonadota bacterium]MDR7500040.1 glycosyltransferase family 4 protein [Armatimonadota bacterium]
MRVIILTQHYKPEPLPKAHELAEGLAVRGHQVTVITGFPNYPTGRLYDGYRIRPWTVQTIDGVRVVRLALYPDHSASALRRLANYGSFMAMAAVLGPIFAGPADAMFVIHPPLTIAIPAYVIGRLRHVPYVFAVGDLWPEAIVAAGMLREGLPVRMLRRLARFAYRHAAVVAPVTSAIGEHLAAAGVPRARLRVIPDWVDEVLYRPLPPDPALAAQLGVAGRFTVMFAGQIGIVQHLSTVVEAAALLGDHPDVRFVIVGDGVDRARLIRDVEARRLTNITFPGQRPPEEMPRLLALADVLLVHLSGDPIFRLSVPAKVYAYMACGKPILAALDGAGAEVVRAAGAGLVCPPAQPRALADAVLEFRRLSVATRQEMGRRAREVFLGRYARRVVLDQCEALLARVARDRRQAVTES